MRVVAARRRVIEHCPMDIGKDARALKTLSRYVVEQVITLSSEGILLADAQDPGLPVVYANPAYEDLSGYSAEELIGQAWPLAERDCEGQPEIERIKAAIGRAEPCQATVPDVRKDGTSWFSEVSVEPLYTARGDLRYFLCLQKPAAARERRRSSVEVGLLQRELARARQKIATLDRVDPATGLLQFDYFRERLNRDIAVARRDRRTVTLLLFEVLEFDVYRQTFGGKAADYCQRMIGAQITRTLRRAGDLCARCDDSLLVASILGQETEDGRALAARVARNVRGLGLHNPRAKSGRYVAVRSAVVDCVPGSKGDADAAIARGLAELKAAAGTGAGQTATQ